MIKQRYRFHGHSSLKYVFSKGQQSRGRGLSIKFVYNTKRQYSRVAIIVSKKVLKHAVDRNRVRRRVYEIMRTRLTDFNKVVDLAIIIYRAEVMTMDQSELVNQVDKCLASLLSAEITPKI